MKIPDGVNNFELPGGFSLKDFQDPTTGDVKLWRPLLIKLISVQSLLGERLIILSGYRTKKYNSTLKYSVPNSAHLYGLAVDARTEDCGHERVAHFARLAGIKRIKVYPAGKLYGKGWVHLGFNDYKL